MAKTIDHQDMLRVYGANYHALPAEVRLLVLSDSGSVIQDLVCWLFQNKNRHEKIELSQWDGSKWYIEVKEMRLFATAIGINEHIGSRIVGITIDVATSKILWNHLDGNCWCRDRRWFQLIVEKFPKFMEKNECCNCGSHHLFQRRYIHKYIYKTTLSVGTILRKRKARIMQP